MASSSPDLSLGLPGFVYADLHDPHRLSALYETFCREVESEAPELWAQWDAYRRDPDAVSVLDRSDLIVRMAPRVSRFVARLFRVEDRLAGFAAGTADLEPLFRFKIDFVRKRALPLLKGGVQPRPDPADTAVVDELTRPWAHLDAERALALAGCDLLDRETALRDTGSEALRAALTQQAEALRRWCAARVHDPAYAGWVVFRFPATLDYEHLVHVERPRADLPQAMVAPPADLRRRDGFSLTDDGWSPREVLSETHYCVLCHERDKDSCSKGHRTKDGGFQINPLGIPLQGCPLDEKISEMHTLRRAGDPLGALSIVTIDNPMCPGTGHRICNDCMKSCIYQKQEPVNIPQIETGALSEVLDLPWGVEIYGLLTRWNPLNVRRPYALPYNGHDVLVVGLGPAGYTLTHYLTKEGFGVVAIDGLKLEPLPPAAFDETGGPRPIAQWDEIYSPLDTRVIGGFGGVSEYGITVRWDKNFLTLMHLTLARRPKARLFGGVRFGSTLTLDDAWAYGFAHVAIAAGAGRPTVLDFPHKLTRGVRQSTDLLMSLQLGGAFKAGALPVLQLRLPAVVIGGGLTGIDTSTESFAYYPVQVERTLDRYEALVAAQGEAAVRAAYDADDLEVLDEFLTHGQAVRAERARAAAAGESPDFVPLMRSWGGVTLAYRKRMVDSPAYRLNHEEVEQALGEGIAFAENLDPRDVLPDARGRVEAVLFEGPDGPVRLPARSVFVAAGTSPYVIYEHEFPGTFALDAKGRFFEGYRAEPGADGPVLTPDPHGFFTSYARDGRLVSFYGDAHPRYAGNVVKAMASAKHAHPQIAALFRAPDPSGQAPRDDAWRRFASRMDDEFNARVVSVERLAPSIVRVVVRAAAAARRFQAGQFFRLQSFESLAPTIEAPSGVSTRLVMEGLALAPTAVDRGAGLLTFVVHERGGSSRLAAYLPVGAPVVLMGPTGAPVDLPSGADVLLVGGGTGHPVLLSLAASLRGNGCRVVYAALDESGDAVASRDAIEDAADQVIWVRPSGPGIVPRRPQDTFHRGGVVEALVAEAGQPTAAGVPLAGVTQVVAAGPPALLAAVHSARHGVLAAHLPSAHRGFASVPAPMQCMMKEICAQCLHRQVDPATGRDTVVYACAHPVQPMECVDYGSLAGRLGQNAVQERLTGAWLEQVLADAPVPHV